MEELSENLKIISRALNNISVQLGALDPAALLLASNNSENAPTHRRSGYVNWNSSHDILKAECWKRMSPFTEYCGLLDKGNRAYFDLHVTMSAYDVVNEETRFPTDAMEQLYINISSPLVSAEILYMKEQYNPTTGLLERFLNVVKDETHTRSSFEKKYGLKWVEPSSVVEAEPINDTIPITKPINVSIEKPVIQDPWSYIEDLEKEDLDADNTEDRPEEDLEVRELRKKFEDILNKLTLRNLNELKKVIMLEIKDHKQLEVFIDTLYEKAMKIPSSSNVYAALVKKLRAMKVPTTEDPERSVSFQGLIINKCQKSFEARKSDEEVTMENELAENNDPTNKKKIQMKLNKKIMETRKRAVANAIFIAEFYKNNVVSWKIMDYCLKVLSEELEEDKLECLCEILTIAGEQFECDYTGKHSLDDIFDKMKKNINSTPNNISHRVRFMVQDVVDLRQRKWVMIAPPVVKGLPKTIDEIQEESEKRALLIELMKDLDIRAMRSNSGVDVVQRIEEGFSKHDNAAVGNKHNTYTVDTLKLKAATQETQNYIQHPPECFIKVSDSILEKLKTVPTTRGDTSTTDPEVLPTYQLHSATIKKPRTYSTEILTPVIPKIPITDSKVRSLVKSLVDDYLITQDPRSLMEKMKQLSTQNHAVAVDEMIKVILAKNIEEAEIVAKSILKLVKNRTISPENFVAGLKETFTYAHDLVVDIPLLYDYLGSILSPHIVKNHITLAQIFELSEVIIAQNQGGLLLASIIDCLSEEVGQGFVTNLWQKSGMNEQKLSEWMRAESVPEWIYDNDFEFLHFDSSL